MINFNTRISRQDQYIKYVSDYIDKLNEAERQLEPKLETVNLQTMATNSNLPTRQDYSQTAIKKALFQKANSHWTARYTLPTAGGIALFGFVSSSWAVILPIVLVLAVGASMWVYHVFVNAHNFEMNYLKGLQDRIDTETTTRRKDLKQNLLIYGCEDGARQLVQFQNKLNTLLDILKLKFDENQMTYKRYYGISQEVFLSGIDNLTKIVIAYKTLESVDITHINSRLKSLARQDPSKDLVLQKEYDALMRAKDSYGDQKSKIRILLSENTSALVEIDQTTVAISNIEKSKNNEASVDMENSMNQLQELAERSHIYSR